MSVSSILLSVSLFSIAAFGQTYISFENKDGLNVWWHAFYINDLIGDLDNVEILDSSTGAMWTSGYSEVDADDYTFYAFQNNDGWVLPLSVRLTNCDGNELTFYDIITNRDTGAEFDTMNNFIVNSCAPETSDNIIITNKDGINAWWQAFFIDNENADVALVEFRDNSGADWVEGYSGVAGDDIFYAFQGSGPGWVLPYSVRLTDCNGNVIIGDGIITNILTGSEFDFGDNFPDAPCVTPTTTTPPINPDNILVTKFQGYNPWWVALEVENVNLDSGVTITSVELRDSGENPIWVSGVYYDWGGVKPWTFNVHTIGRQFEIPFDLRITLSNGNSLESTDDFINSWDDGAEFDFGSNF